MNRYSLVFLDTATVDLGDLDLSGLTSQGEWTRFEHTPREQVLERLAEADVAIMNKCVLDATHFRSLPQLKLVCVAATGVNNIDLEAARRHRVAVTNVPGYSTPAVAEHTVLFMLALGHRLLEHHQAAVGGAWSASPLFTVLDFPFFELRGKTLGIVGYGAIGTAVACLAKALGMRVLVAKLPGRRYAKGVKRCPFSEVLRQSDFVSLHCPLTQGTERLMRRETLMRMKPGAYLLNLARGGVVDEGDVAAALRSGRLAGYGADVLSHEPPPADHPLLDPVLRGRVLLTPHVAWASREARQRLMDEIAKNISAWRRGRRRNRVD